jgi:replication initiation and membrane attachment protein DnaB
MYFISSKSKDFDFNLFKKIILKYKIKNYKFVNMGKTNIFKFYAGIIR